MMKANNQLGFININEDSIDKIIKDDEVIFERGFLREKTSTTLPITFGGVGKDLKDYKIYGNTYQNSTRGVNLFNHYLYPVSRTYNGVSITNNEDGSFTLNGTCTSNNTAFAIGLDAEIQQYVNEGRVTQTAYYISGTCTKGSSSNARTTIRLNYDTGYDKMIPLQNLSTQGIISKTHPQDSREAGWSWRIVLDAGDTFDNFTIKYQLEKGSEATEYEPYTGGQPSPNPDYPQEIISCGDRTKNLCFTNFDNWESGQYYTNGEKTDMYARIRLKELFKVETGKQYYFNTFSEFKFILRTYDENKDFISSYGAIENGNTLTIQTAKYLGITIYNPNDSSLVYSDYETLFKNGTIRPLICLNSETDKSYEPYGYKIPVNVRSDNLFDKSNTTTGYYIDSNGDLTSHNSFAYSDYIQIKENTVYSYSGSTGLANYARKCAWYDSSKNLIRVDNFGNSGQLTSPNNAKYFRTSVRIIASGTQDADISTYQLVESSTVPSKYIPYYNQTTNIYLDEPLRKIDEYNDYIDFANSKVVRRIKEVLLSSENNWASASNTRPVFSLSTFTDKLDGRDNFICSHFKYLGNAQQTDLGFAMSFNSGQYYRYLYIQVPSSIAGVAEVSNFKTWFGTIEPVTLDYPLATPIEESITLPNIPTIDGNNTLNIETEITSSQVYIKYKSNS